MSLKEEYEERQRRKRRRKRAVIITVSAVVLVIAALVIMSVLLEKNTPEAIEVTTAEPSTQDIDLLRYSQDLKVAAGKLEEMIFTATESEEDLSREAKITESLEAVEGWNGSYTVFLSVADTDVRAAVFHKSAPTLREAFDAVFADASDYVTEKRLDPRYVRVDCVNGLKKIQTADFASEVEAGADWYAQCFRYGVAFDDGFGVALTETEINANEIIDYANDRQLRPAYLNRYLGTYGIEQFETLPDEITLFTCAGFICEPSGCYELSSDVEDGDYGTRVSADPDAEECLACCKTAFEALADGMSDDGTFSYGVYPVIDTAINSYDMMRHAEALDAMIRYCSSVDGTALYTDKIKAAAQKLASAVVAKDATASYVADRESGEINIGACAMAITAFVDYGKFTGDTQFDAAASLLGAGLLALRGSDGLCAQRLYYGSAGGDDFTAIPGDRNVSLDPAVVTAFCKLRELTGDDVWLEAAELSADALYTGEYWQYYDAALARAMNELTKYSLKEKYYTLALRNVGENLTTIAGRRQSQVSFLSLVADTFEVLRRADDNNIHSEYIDAFDREGFFTAIRTRAHRSLDGYGYPEISMYFRTPSLVTGNYFVRNDMFRVRIDDTAHFIDSLLMYSAVYTDLDAEIISNQAAAEEGTTAEQSEEGTTEAETAEDRD